MSVENPFDVSRLSESFIEDYKKIKGKVEILKLWIKERLHGVMIQSLFERDLLVFLATLAEFAHNTAKSYDFKELFNETLKTRSLEEIERKAQGGWMEMETGGRSYYKVTLEMFLADRWRWYRDWIPKYQSQCSWKSWELCYNLNLQGKLIEE